MYMYEYTKKHLLISGWCTLYIHYTLARIYMKKTWPFYGCVQNWNEEIFTKYNHISSDHTFYACLLDVFFFLSISLFVFVHSWFCSFSYFFFHHLRLPHSFFWRLLMLLPFQDFHLLLFRKMYTNKDSTLDLLYDFILMVCLVLEKCTVCIRYTQTL